MAPASPDASSGDDIGQRPALSGPCESSIGLGRFQPFESVVLGTQPDLCVLRRQWRRRRAPVRPHRSGADRMTRPGSGCRAAPPLNPVSSASSLAAASAGRSPGSMWPCTVSHEPGQRPPAARRSTRHSRRAADTSHDVHVHERYTDRSHGRHSAKAESSWIPDCWDFSG